jgi:ParB family chromosome partitioning protein
MTKKTGLGRGLGALIPNDISQNVKDKINESGELVDEIEIDLIIPNRDQPRKEFDKEKIQNLANSIQEHGLIQPIILKRSGSFYEIIAGERRWRACKLLELKRVQAIIKDVDAFTIAQLALIENLQREDLNPIEEAMAFQNLITEYSMTQESLARIVGKSRSYITNYMRMLKLDPIIQKGIMNELISHGHGRALLAIDSEKTRLKAFDLIVEKQLSVRETEKLVKNIDQYKDEQAQSIKPVKLPSVLKVEHELSSMIGTKVNIKEKNGKGKIEISFYDVDDLNRILDTLKG